MMGRVALAALVCACSVVVTDAREPFGRKSDLQSRLAKQPITFYLARGGEDSCGPGCREWIAADGQFDEGSAARFRTFLAKAKAANLPVFFNSNGGLQHEAMAIGRLLREKGLRAGVAFTRPHICSRKPENIVSCDTAKKSGKAIQSEWTSYDANCNSACGIALIGATDRWIPPGSSIGIHSPAYFCFLRSGRIVGQKGNGELAAQCRKFTAQGAAQLAAYANEMGIGPGYVEAMNKVPHTEVRYLTREELVRFGIDKSGIAETPWMGKPDMAHVTLKVLLEATGADGGKRMGWLELQCNDRGTSAVVFVRPAIGGDDGVATEVELLAGERKFAFSPKDVSTHRNPTEPAAPYLRRRMLVPIPDVAAMAAEPAMDLRITLKAGADDAKTQVTRISTAGLPQRWGAVAESCKTKE
jgi:hypothetical protein